MRVHVMDLQQGDLLKEDTFNKYGVHLLKGGAEINNEALSLLLQHGIDYVEVEDRDLQEAQTMTAEPSIDVSSEESYDASAENSYDASAEKLKKNIDSTVASYQFLFLDVITKGKISNERIDNSLSELLDSLEGQKDVVSLLLMLEREHTNTYAHSLKVGVLSYYIAKWLGYSEEEVYKITKAGYLHDIGISRISPSLRNLSLDLTEAEQDAFKRHTAYGYEIIINSIQDEASALVAFQHHERGDGSGYPKALTKDEIHPYAQIVAVADVFVEMGLTGPGQIKEGFLTVLRKVHEMSFGRLSEKPVQIMMQHLLPQLVGKQVSLSNGETAVIVLNNPLDFFRPLVKVGEQFRDLSKEQQISMIDIVEAV